MPGSPSGDTAAAAPISAPPFPLLSRGHQVLIKINVLDAFADEIRIMFRVGNYIQHSWIPRSLVVEVVGFDERLAGLDDEQTKAVNLAAALA